MLGHHNAWDYGWGFFLIALDEAVKNLPPATDET
jgi:hypothetical protein